jgi:hypothetical protein
MAPRAPIERRPPVTLPRGWHALQNFGIPYRPRDKPDQEDWASVARKFDVDVKELIFFNFFTTDPDEVNWYLHHHVGCDKPSPSGNNWMFSNSATPGIIYIPPADDISIDFEAIDTCTWLTKDANEFIKRLSVVAKMVDGEQGKRVKKMVEIIARAGYPAARELWYYNTMVVKVYIDWTVGNAKRREMRSGTGGVYPFDGLSGVYGQQGTQEQHRGYWRIHAVNDLFNDFGCGQWDANAMKDRLIRIDQDMYKGWYEMTIIDFKTHQGGGASYDVEIEHFVNHVTHLSKDKNHLYSMLR